MEEHPLSESAWRRGWQNTKAVWKSWQFYVFGAIGGFTVGGVFEWYWGLALFVFGMICVWIGTTARAPITQRNEARNRVRVLEEERIPRITAKPYSGRRQWEHEHEHLMWAELQVTNPSPSQGLNDVEVRVVSCVNVAEQQDAPDNYMLVELNSWSPTGVYWSERDAPPHQLKCAIPPNSTRNALVAYQNNSNGITTIFNSPISPNPIIVGGARIEIEVSSPDSALWEGAFYIQCHPNYAGGARATFEFVEWETWTNSRNEIHPLATDKGDSETE